MCKCRRKNWKCRVSDMLAGVTDHDDWQQVVMKCAALADMHSPDEFPFPLSFQDLTEIWEKSMLALAKGKAVSTMANSRNNHSTNRTIRDCHRVILQCRRHAFCARLKLALLALPCILEIPGARRASAFCADVIGECNYTIEEFENNIYRLVPRPR